jgi:NhaP-type Na+/H+ or K+/H+ antiporter
VSLQTLRRNLPPPEVIFALLLTGLGLALCLAVAHRHGAFDALFRAMENR